MDSIALRPREMPRITINIPAPASGGSNPFCLQTKTVSHCRVDILSGGVSFHRAKFWKPPFAWALPATSGSDSDPRPFVDYSDYSFHVLFTRTTSGTPSIYETVSTDGGQTWGAPTLWLTNAKHPFCVSTVTDSVIRGGVLSGAVQATLQKALQAGQLTPVNFQSSGVNIAVNDDTLAIDQEKQPPFRLLSHLNRAGDTATSLWRSSGPTDLQAWTLIGAGITGGLNPTVAVGVSGRIIWAARAPQTGIYTGDSTIQFLFQHGGSDLALIGPFTFRSGGNDLLISSDTFQVQHSAWGSGWVLTAVDTTGTAREWESGDECMTWTLI